MTPKHVAIIMDGNGRWAKSKGMPRNYGHSVGAKNVEIITEAAKELGIKYLTLYAFSTENWNRPQAEVNALMMLFSTYLDTCLKKCRDHNMRFRVIGDKSGLSDKLRNQMEMIEKETAIYDDIHLTLAINYGSRDEIVRSVKKIATKVSDGSLSADAIDEAIISDNLDTAGIPDPDLLIRTSGEQRLSNYLLWQLAYAEFYFTPKAWPEFSKEDLAEALAAYEDRDRRYGKL